MGKKIKIPLVMAFIATFCVGCAGGGGGSAAADGGSSGDTPDFTPRTYILRVLGQTVAPFKQTVNLAMECNINAGAPTYRNENANLSLDNNELGGVGCANIWNVEFTLNNTSAYQSQWFVFVDYGSGEVQLANGIVAAGQSQVVFQQGYIQP
jgi:hypothetical protein